MHSRGCCCSLFWLLIFSHLYTKYSVSGGSLIFVLLQTVNLNFKTKNRYEVGNHDNILLFADYLIFFIPSKPFKVVMLLLSLSIDSWG